MGIGTLFETQVKIGIADIDFKKGIAAAGSMVKDFAVMGGRYLADFAKDSVATGEQFDSSMAQVAATMGSTIDEIQDLRDYAREMGATTAFSASQAADALNYMALAGYDAEQSMAMLPNVLNLAAAGSIDLAYASNMVTDAQSALGLTAEETTELVDKMATAASNSNTSVAQLGSAILTVGGTAKNLKGGTTELATVLGILADNGIKGAEGGTALRNMLNTLAAPTGDAATTLEELGVQVYDTEGNMRSLNDVFGDMKKGLDQLTQQERMQAISNIFNVRDMKSAEAILGSVGDRYIELSGAIDNAAGAAAQMAETQLDTLAGDKTKFQSAFEGLKISVSDSLTPTLREGVQFGTKWIERISKGIERGDPKAVTRAVMHMLKWGIKDIKSAAIEVIPEAANILTEDILKPIGDEILKLFPDWFSDDVRSIFSSVSNFASNIDFDKIGTALGDLSDSLGKFGEKISGGIAWAFENVLSPLGTWLTNEALPAGIDLVAAAFDNMTNTLEFLEPIGAAVWDNFLKPLAENVGDFSVGAITLLGDGLKTVADTFKGVDWDGFWTDLDGFWDNWKVGMKDIGANLEANGEAIEDFFGESEIGKKWFSFWEGAGSGVFTFRENVGEWLGEVVLFFEDVIDEAKEMSDKIIDYFGKIGKKIKGWSDFWKGFGDYLATPEGERDNIDSNADGGYVTTPRLSWVAEKEPEYIIPESKMDKVFKNSGNGYTFNFYYQGGSGMKDEEIEEQARRLAELSIAQIRAIGGTGF